jgi:hypothetical protein
MLLLQLSVVSSNYALVCDNDPLYKSASTPPIILKSLIIQTLMNFNSNSTHQLHLAQKEEDVPVCKQSASQKNLNSRGGSLFGQVKTNTIHLANPK